MMLRRNSGLAILSLSVALLAAFASTAATAGGLAPDQFRSRSLDIVETFLQVVVDTTSVRSAVGLELSNRTERPLFVSVRFVLPNGAPAGERTLRLAPRKPASFTCIVDTVIAGADYPADLEVFADSARTDTVEVSATRLRFDADAVRSHGGQLARERQHLPSLVLPRAYERILRPGTMFPTSGTLTVRVDGFDYRAKKHSVTVEAAQVRRIYLQTGRIVVEYQESARSRRLVFDHRPGLEVVLLPRAWAMALANGGRAPDEVLMDVFRSLDSMLGRRANRSEATPDEKPERLTRALRAVVGNAPEPRVDPEERRATLITHAPMRAGHTFELGLGGSTSHIPGDAEGTASGGGIALALGVGAFVDSKLALMLRFVGTGTEGNSELLFVPTAGNLFVGPTAQYWATNRIFFGGGAGLARFNPSVGSGESGLGLELRVGYAVATAASQVAGISLELFPSFYPSGTGFGGTITIHAQRTKF